MQLRIQIKFQINSDQSEQQLNEHTGEHLQSADTSLKNCHTDISLVKSATLTEPGSLLFFTLKLR